MVFTIRGVLPGLNEYTKANRDNRYEGGKMKRETEDMIQYFIRSGLKHHTFSNPVRIDFLWVEPNMRRDKDNIAFAKKFIIDALVKEGTIKNDGWQNILGFTDHFDVDKNNPRVEVSIYEEQFAED